ncbi:MAG: hypothetical protein V1821_00875 [bacterium]
MFASSQDILYIVLAFCILWVTVFLCWLLYHVVTILRTAENFMREIEDKAHKIDVALRGLKDRMEYSASHLGVIGDALKHLVAHFMERKKEK